MKSSSSEKRMLVVVLVFGLLAAVYFLTQPSHGPASYEASSVQSPKEEPPSAAKGAVSGTGTKSVLGSDGQGAEKTVAQGPGPAASGAGASESQAKPGAESGEPPLIDRAQREKLLSTQKVFQ